MPVGSPYNGGQSPLEAAAIAARNTLLPINTYNNANPANEYSATHTRAVSDQTTPVYGKGSGQYLDIDNYGGVGGSYDIYGNQSLYIGSGRVPAFAMNSGMWGYGPVGLGLQNYTHPDTSANIGQVII
jgi:hypothetical protein